MGFGSELGEVEPIYVETARAITRDLYPGDLAVERLGVKPELLIAYGAQLLKYLDHDCLVDINSIREGFDGE
jgi:hypothetical protein